VFLALVSNGPVAHGMPIISSVFQERYGWMSTVLHAQMSRWKRCGPSGMCLRAVKPMVSQSVLTSPSGCFPVRTVGRDAGRDRCAACASTCVARSRKCWNDHESGELTMIAESLVEGSESGCCDACDGVLVGVKVMFRLPRRACGCVHVHGFQVSKLPAGKAISTSWRICRQSRTRVRACHTRTY